MQMNLLYLIHKYDDPAWGQILPEKKVDSMRELGGVVFFVETLRLQNHGEKIDVHYRVPSGKFDCFIFMDTLYVRNLY